MFLTISTTHRPATDLGYLLHKNPGRGQTVALSFGRAHVFYPEASEDRCTVALWVDVDALGLVRGKGSRGLFDYVNDRPYAASSFLSVAIGEVFGTAMAGRSRERPELAGQPLPLSATVEAVPCQGGAALVRRLFEPLGYDVRTTGGPLDVRFPSWGDSPYLHISLAGTVTLAALLTHLNVLIPVLDDDKHYWVGEDEVDKLLRRGEGWLAAHPERDVIVDRYLRHRRALTRAALGALAEDDAADPDVVAQAHDREEEAVERPLSLQTVRMQSVLAALRGAGARRVVDVGCGEGQLLGLLLDDAGFSQVVGLDVSTRALERAAQRLRLERMPQRKRDRLTLLHGSLTYRDERLAGFDAATAVEVIEHIDPPRIPVFTAILLGHMRPATAVVTTPNVEYNVRFGSLPAGRLRHRDHRFEWSRDEFAHWSTTAAEAHGYAVRHLPVGEVDPEVGPPTQMAVFTR